MEPTTSSQRPRGRCPSPCGARPPSITGIAQSDHEAITQPVSGQYLAWAFDRLGTHRDIFGLTLEDLTPAAFKKTLA